MNNELNKYFPTDITNIILEIHYKTIFNESIEYLNEKTTEFREVFFEKEDSDEKNEKRFMSNFSLCVRNRVFTEKCDKAKRKRREERQNLMTEDSDEDSAGFDSDGDSYGRYEKKTHCYLRQYYSPEEFEYKKRYPESKYDEDSDEDCDW